MSSLLNAMTVDPEEFLADLGFAETDLRMRIPDRFFESASRAQGIDVDSFRRSLEHDDLYGSAVRKEYSLIYLVYYRGHDCPSVVAKCRLPAKLSG